MDDLTEAARRQYIHATLRERIVEHVFVGDALRRLWQLGVPDVEVLRSEFDAGGYDLVMSHRRSFGTFSSRRSWYVARPRTPRST